MPRRARERPLLKLHAEAAAADAPAAGAREGVAPEHILDAEKHFGIVTVFAVPLLCLVSGGEAMCVIRDTRKYIHPRRRS